MKCCRVLDIDIVAITSFGSDGDLLDDRFGDFRVFDEELTQTFANDGGDDLSDLGVTKFGLGLSFVLWVRMFNGDDRG